jgi:hypothetical protein
MAFAKEYFMLMGIYFHMSYLLKIQRVQFAYVSFTDFKKALDRVNKNVFAILILVALPMIHPPVAEVIHP